MKLLEITTKCLLSLPFPTIAIPCHCHSPGPATNHYMCYILLVQIANSYALDILIFSNSIHTPLSSISTFLDASKRSLASTNFSCVHSNHSTLKTACHAHYTPDILREEISCESKLCVICQFNCLLFSLECEYRCQWAEGLIVG